MNNSLFQPVDTALTKYSTLRIVHIGRTEEGGKTCGPGFPSQVWIGSRYLSREKKKKAKKKRKATLKDNTLGRLFFSPPLIFSRRLFFSTQIVLNVWDSGNYTARWDDDEGGTAGWTELGPLLDAHSWGGGREHSRAKVRMPKSIWFFSRIPSSSYRPLNPLNTLYQLRSPNKCPPFGFSLLSLHQITHYCDKSRNLPPYTPACFSPLASLPMFSIRLLHHLVSSGVRCLTEMVSCFLPAAVSAWHGHIMKSSPLPTSENPIFSISSWRCMTDRVSPWRSKGQLLWTLWRKKK